MIVRKRIGPIPAVHYGVLLAFIFCVLSASAAAPTESVNVGRRIFEWRPFLAPFHAVVLHFPIGFITVAFILEIYRLARPSEELRRATTLVLWLTLLSGVITATFGIMRAETGGYEPTAVNMHRAYGLWVPILTFATLMVQKIAYRNEAARAWTTGYRLLLTATIGLIAVAGHLGGSLTHGAGYLVENAPEFVRELVDEPAAAPQKTAVNENERFFNEKVQPILKAKCYQCHGSQKQKGHYRLDEAATVLKGGESGKPAIKPGDPGESNLVRLILLPREHDDCMPPSGKEALTSDEIVTILTWVRNGAHLPSTSTEATTADRKG